MHRRRPNHRPNIRVSYGNRRHRGVSYGVSVRLSKKGIKVMIGSICLIVLGIILSVLLVNGIGIVLTMIGFLGMFISMFFQESNRGSQNNYNQNNSSQNNNYQSESSKSVNSSIECDYCGKKNNTNESRCTSCGANI